MEPRRNDVCSDAPDATTFVAEEDAEATFAFDGDAFVLRQDPQSKGKAAKTSFSRSELQLRLRSLGEELFLQKHQEKVNTKI